jgi:2-succinyl-6-hydroxy-2,4-cyclohexadiene-1-carboxylate synthase
MPTRVVYLHGMGGSPEDWRPVQARQPGLAVSLDAEAGDPAELAAALAEQIPKQVSGSIALCGYSMGGRIALLTTRALLARNKKPDGLILVASGFGTANESENAERNATDEKWAALVESNKEEFWTKWYEQELFASFRALPEAARGGWLDHRKALDAADIARQLRNLGPGRHGDLLPVLKEVTSKGVRVLYVAGDADAKYAGLLPKLAEFPGVQTSVIQGAGHVLPLEAPEALAARIARFIK